MRLRLAAVLVPLVLMAAPDPFVGTWKLNPEKSTFEKGSPPPPPGITMTYSRQADVVTVTATVPLPDGKDRKIVHTETYDGQAHDRYEGKPNGETLTHRRVDERTVTDSVGRWSDAYVGGPISRQV